MVRSIRNPLLFKLLYLIVTKSIRKDFDEVCHWMKANSSHNISENILTTLIVAEDRRFYQHCGIDARSILRALYSTIFFAKLQGASTIEQQLVRTITKQYEISIVRKCREILISIMISMTFPKIYIANCYLLVAYFGWQMNGVYQAAHRMNIDVHCVSKEDAASIIARLKYPEPEIMSEKRKMQIENRKHYLLKLYYKSNQPSSL